MRIMGGGSQLFERSGSFSPTSHPEERPPEADPPLAESDEGSPDILQPFGLPRPAGREGSNARFSRSESRSKHRDRGGQDDQSGTTVENTPTGHYYTLHEISYPVNSA